MNLIVKEMLKGFDKWLSENNRFDIGEMGEGNFDTFNSMFYTYWSWGNENRFFKIDNEIYYIYGLIVEYDFESRVGIEDYEKFVNNYNGVDTIEYMVKLFVLYINIYWNDVSVLRKIRKIKMADLNERIGKK